MRLTPAQNRLVEQLKAEDGAAEFWPLMNNWVKGDSRNEMNFALAHRNICRTVDVLVRKKVIVVDDDGMVKLVTP